MLRQAGFEQDALMAEGIVFVVRHMDIDFLRPARFNQALTVASEIQELAGASITFRQLLQDDRGQGFCQAQVKVGCLNAKTFRPVRIPLAIKQELARVG